MKLTKIMNNFHAVEMKNKALFFSYETPIGYFVVNHGVVIAHNKWSQTTGKHLNWIKKNHDVKEEVPHTLLENNIDVLFE